MSDYWDWVKRNFLVVYPNMQDKPVVKKGWLHKWLHRHKRVLISDRCAADIKLCLTCGEITVERWSNDETKILGYVDPKKDGVYSGLLGTIPKYLKDPTMDEVRSREKESDNYFKHQSSPTRTRNQK